MPDRFRTVFGREGWACRRDHHFPMISAVLVAPVAVAIVVAVVAVVIEMAKRHSRLL